MAAVSRHSTDNLILLAGNAVTGSFGVALSASSVILGLPSYVLGLSLLLKVGRAEDIAQRLFDVALGRMELTGGLAVGSTREDFSLCCVRRDKKVSNEPWAVRGHDKDSSSERLLSVICVCVDKMTGGFKQLKVGPFI